MADIRIKDLATTATTTASDDFMAVDGVTNGTRKLSAATPAFLTSVTTPSLTSPASTNLTLAGGSSGASLVLEQGATAANVTLNATTSGFLSFTKSEDSSTPSLARLFNPGATTAGRYNEVIFGKSLANGGAGTLGYKSDSATPANSRLYLVHYGNNQDTGGINLTNTGNLLIGTSTSLATYGKLVVSGGMTTSDDANGKLVVGRYSAGVPNSYIKLGALSTSLRITNAADSADLVTILNTGEVSIASTTAGSSGAGALVVQGGISAGNTGSAASYFGGAVSAQGNVAVTNTNLTGAALSARYNASNQRIGFNIQNSNGPASLAWNAASTTSSDTLNYDITQAAGKIGLNSATGAMTLSVAASGTAGNAITFTDAVSITPTGATFAGAVTATGGLTASSWSLLGAGVWPTTAMGQNGSRVVSSSATENQLFTILNMNTAASGAVGINYGASIYLGARGTDNTADMAIAEIFGARESATSGNLTSYLSFKTSNSIGARTEALRLASTGAATFAGAVTATGNFTHNGSLIGISGTTAAQYLSFNSSTGGAAYLARENSTGTAFAGQAYSLQLYTDSKPIVLAPGGVNKFQLDTSGAATFAGAVAIGNTTAASVAAPSTHKVSILIGGVQYYLLASNV